jgi:hypothetical protein
VIAKPGKKKTVGYWKLSFFGFVYPGTVPPQPNVKFGLAGNGTSLATTAFPQVDGHTIAL